jgi:Hsp20/alpha crystallin family
MINMAVAGFSQDELTVTMQPNQLVGSGHKHDEKAGEYLHRGIAQRAFERRFELADYVNVVAANLDNGLLTIELKREIPEEMKPRRIAVTWSDLDRRKQLLKVERARVAGVLKAETKTHRVRFVELTSRAFAAIEHQREFTALQGGEMFMEPGFNRPWRDDRR